MMEKTLKVINALEKEGVISRYALGGATALLFYAEPALTYDVDVFVFLPDDQPGTKRLVDLGPVCRALKAKNYHPDKEHVVIEGIPVQFIPVYNPLVEEAVKKASVREYQGIKTKVMRVEHLLAIMIDTNRPRDRERLAKLQGEVDYDRQVLGEILDRHGLRKKWEKQFEKG